ncbi:MAG: hypothetical protein KC619_19615 [Myxococcales bacterium]|nr:hypothetical protein [Myxococcales bacterium]
MTVSVESVALDARTLEQRLTREGRPLSFADVLEGWRTDPAVRRATVAAIAEAPYEALFWETAPWVRGRLDAPYRQVVVNAPPLARVAPDPEAFSAHFGAEDVVAFDNLGGDARLVVPCPRAGDRTYTHLAAAVRGAPAAQIDGLLARVGTELEGRLEDRDVVWVSTSGLGVYWVHVRLDDRPKYYSHAPYRAA